MSVHLLAVSFLPIGVSLIVPANNSSIASFAAATFSPVASRYGLLILDIESVQAFRNVRAALFRIVGQ